jgi:hypothetical protein
MKQPEELKQEAIEMSKGGEVPGNNKWGMQIGEKTGREMARISQSATSLRGQLR